LALSQKKILLNTSIKNVNTKQTQITSINIQKPISHYNLFIYLYIYVQNNIQIEQGSIINNFISTRFSESQKML